MTEEQGLLCHRVPGVFGDTGGGTHIPKAIVLPLCGVGEELCQRKTGALRGFGAPQVELGTTSGTCLLALVFLGSPKHRVMAFHHRFWGEPAAFFGPWHRCLWSCQGKGFNCGVLLSLSSSSSASATRWW